MNENDVLAIQNTLAIYFVDGCLVRWTNAGLLVSVVRDNFTVDEAKNQILDLIGPQLEHHNEIIYQLFLYQSNDQQFRTQATLYTRQSDFQTGMHTTYRQTTDADIFMKEIDFEYLCLADRPTFQMEVRNAGANFRMTDGQTYGELFAMGMDHDNVRANFINNRWWLSFL